MNESKLHSISSTTMVIVALVGNSGCYFSNSSNTENHVDVVEQNIILGIC